MGPKLRQSEALSRTFLTGTTGEDSLLPNLAKGVTPKQPGTLPHIIWRNLRKKEEAQIMLQAVSQVPELPRCPDAVNCKPTHQSSVPLSSWSWPSITSYWKSWTTILSKYSYWAEMIHWALWRYTAKDSFHLQKPWVLRISLEWRKKQTKIGLMSSKIDWENVSWRKLSWTWTKEEMYFGDGYP